MRRSVAKMDSSGLNETAIGVAGHRGEPSPEPRLGAEATGAGHRDKRSHLGMLPLCRSGLIRPYPEKRRAQRTWDDTQRGEESKPYPYRAAVSTIIPRGLAPHLIVPPAMLHGA